jgi:hypothetical protein
MPRHDLSTVHVADVGDVDQLRLAHLSMELQAEIALAGRRRSAAERRLLEENGRLISALATLRRYLRQESRAGRIHLPPSVTAFINQPIGEVSR